jgi:hypothetical protein
MSATTSDVRGLRGLAHKTLDEIGKMTLHTSGAPHALSSG